MVRLNTDPIRIRIQNPASKCICVGENELMLMADFQILVFKFLDLIWIISIWVGGWGEAAWAFLIVNTLR